MRGDHRAEMPDGSQMAARGPTQPTPLAAEPADSSTWRQRSGHRTPLTRARDPGDHAYGPSSFPGASARRGDPVLVDDVLRDFPDLTVVLAHGGRGWSYEAAGFMALARPNLWLDIAGLPPRKLSQYFVLGGNAEQVYRLT